MGFYADLHVHSKHSRATSRDCDLENLAWWAGRKGIAVVGTGDFTHPAWFDELHEKLVPSAPGLFRLRDDLERERLRRLPAACRAPVHFMLSVEISTIYKKGERTRKIHHLIYAPDLDTVARLRKRLSTIGNLNSDGRPILGLDSRHLLEITLEAGEGAYLIPAHVWTPWFAVLGSMSGFDDVADCYGDLSEHVFAIETGLSSDPPMNWRVSSLDRYRLISSSDAHSPPVLGREACVFECDIDYFALRRALETGVGYGGTVEFFPEEGKYHLDGHRKCGVRLTPEETRGHGGRCPTCTKPVTVGVMNRVETLADRVAECVSPPTAAPYRNLVQLPQIVGEIVDVGARSKSVAREVEALVDRLGPELGILEAQPIEDIRRASSSLLAEAIARLRRGEVTRDAGYDGEYGTIRMFRPDERARGLAVRSLFEPTPSEAAATATTETQARAPYAAPIARAAAAAAELASATVGAEEPTWEAPATSPLDRTRDARDDRAPSVLDALDDEQRAAASHVEGPLLVLAGPGTGKTRTLTRRIAHLIAERGVAPESCLAITFTRRAAEEMRSRLAALLGTRSEGVVVTTFHGLGLAILREHGGAVGLQRGFRIASDAESVATIRALTGAPVRRARRLLNEVSRARRAVFAPGAPPPDATAVERAKNYRDALWEQDRVDLDDLIARPVELLASHPEIALRYRERFASISVDELQDIDAAQYALVRHLALPAGNLFAIGDPDQAIYGFRGAAVGFFLRFRDDFPGTREVALTRCYRSTEAIVAGALQSIAPGSLVPGRRLVAVAASSGSRSSASVADAAAAPALPERIVLRESASERAEAEGVVHAIEQHLGGYSYFSIDSGRAASGAAAGLSFGDFAVLYRTDAQSRALVEAFERAGIPFQKRSHARLSDHPGVQAILQELNRGETLATDGGDASDAVSRALRAAGEAACAAAREQSDHRDAKQRGERPLRVVLDEIEAGVEMLAPLAARAQSDRDALLDALALGAEIDTRDERAERVSLLTLHAAKGLEFPVVFIAGCEDGLLPLRFASASAAAHDDRAALDEERRLLFVGMTRARTHLVLSWAGRRRGAQATRARSPFLDDIEEALLERQRSDAATSERPSARTRSRMAEASREQLTLL